jgi:hypothetical protein
MIAVAFIVVLALIISILAVFLIKKSEAIKKVKGEFTSIESDYNEMYERYKGVINLETELHNRTTELNALVAKLDNLGNQFALENSKLNKDFQNKRTVYESLLKEVSLLEENLEDISYGIYKPHFTYATSDEYKESLIKSVEKQKETIRLEKATFCPQNWIVEGSAEKGKKMVKEASKLMLRAFNGECDAAIAKVTWNNISNMEARIKKAFEALNKLGSTNKISITDYYRDLKLEELWLEFELQKKIQAEKEEQRTIREQMREEEKALKELEKAAKDAQIEEERYEKALEKAKLEVEKASGAELEKLNAKIAELNANLENAHIQKERAISQAQLTKSGHVYIISNIGSFGDNIYKIGMTRRLEPLDRVKELGDASVPFDFDVHGMIYSDNAPALENTLHRHLENKRLNLANTRAEFFVTSIDEIEQIIKEFNLTVKLTKLAEAKEFRESNSIREEKARQLNNKSEIHKTQAEKQLERFPTSLSA